MTPGVWWDVATIGFCISVFCTLLLHIGNDHFRLVYDPRAEQQRISDESEPPRREALAPTLYPRLTDCTSSPDVEALP
eukprot:1057430-Prymnesium_polylepis.2